VSNNGFNIAAEGMAAYQIYSILTILMVENFDCGSVVRINVGPAGKVRLGYTEFSYFEPRFVSAHLGWCHVSQFLGHSRCRREVSGLSVYVTVILG